MSAKTKVFKYQVAPMDNLTTGTFVIKVPKGSLLLSVAAQNGFLVAYYEVDERQQYFNRELLVVETGKEIELHRKQRKFIDTVQFLNGNYVVHVFEVEA